jgi:transposase
MLQAFRERRSAKEKERDERDEKIYRMVALGCAYEDIGRRYGVSPKSIPGIVRRLGKDGVKRMFKGTGDNSRACYMGGIS